MIELLVVIGILGILVAAVLVLVNPLTQIQRAQDAQRKSNLAQIQRALEQYYQDNQQYPNSTLAVNPTYEIKNTNGTAINWGSPWVFNGVTYMAIVPSDPSSSKEYGYWVSADNQTYRLYASLDRAANDPQACNGVTICPNAPVGACSPTGSATIKCTYGVSSPNTTP